MPFSAETKDELARVLPSRPCCRAAERAAFAAVAGQCRETAEGLVLDFELAQAATARRLFTLWKEVQGVRPLLQVRCLRRPGHRAYAVRLGPVPPRHPLAERLREVAAEALPWRRCCRRAYVRAAFLARGSLVEPEKTYHVEWDVGPAAARAAVADCLASLGLAPRQVRRRRGGAVYLKGAEQVVAVLQLMGAHRALLELENVRIVKEMRSDANRLVNAETANVDKTVRAALDQIEAIRRLEARLGSLERLPRALAEVARARLSQPYASLAELGAALKPPMTKSGVRHRLNRLLELAAACEAGDRLAADRTLAGAGGEPGEAGALRTGQPRRAP